MNKKKKLIELDGAHPLIGAHWCPKGLTNGLLHVGPANDRIILFSTQKILNKAFTGSPLNPNTLMTDFDVGAINSYPDAIQRGCFFHFSQCLC